MLLLTNFPFRLHCIPISFLRSFILLLSTLFVLVIRRTQLFLHTCSFCCCCCSVNATDSRPYRHAGVTHVLGTFPFSFFEMFLSNMTPSTFLQAFAPACFRRRTSAAEYPSSATIHPRYTKPSTCLISLPSNLMVNSSLWCPTHITYFFYRLILSPCFSITPFHPFSTSCRSCLLSAIMARSYAYIIFVRISFVPIFLLIISITMINSKGLRALPWLKPMLTGNSSDNPDINHQNFCYLIHCLHHSGFYLLYSHPSHCCHHHLSRDCVIGLLQVHKSHSHSLLHFQPLL